MAKRKKMEIVGIPVEYYIGFALLIIVIVLGIRKLRGSTNEEFTEQTTELVGKKIVVDAGHGGSDPGLIINEGEEGEVYESHINLEIALYLQELIELSGGEVLMTRTDDTDLAPTKQEDMNERVRVANYNEADVYVSIHQNRFDNPDIKGVQVFYFPGSFEGERLAKTIHKKVEENLNAENERNATATENYFVLLYTEAPSVLIECGFLSNERDFKNLTSESYQKELAITIKEALIEYFNED